MQYSISYLVLISTSTSFAQLEVKQHYVKFVPKYVYFCLSVCIPRYPKSFIHGISHLRSIVGNSLSYVLLQVPAYYLGISILGGARGGIRFHSLLSAKSLPIFFHKGCGENIIFDKYVAVLFILLQPFIKRDVATQSHTYLLLFYMQKQAYIIF